MVEPSEVIAWKYANLFRPDAEMSAEAKRLLPLGGKGSVDWVREKMGGLWVGGVVTLTREALMFGPNAINVAAHAGDTSSFVRLNGVVEVKDRFGWVTRIIDVRTRDGAHFTFRCFGAKAFAERIRNATADLREEA